MSSVTGSSSSNEGIASLLSDRIPWLESVRQNLVSGYSLVAVHGNASDTGTSFRQAWGHASFVDISLCLSPSTVKVASTDAQDTDTTGNGARTLRLAGLDATGAEISETINMNGTTEVESTLTYRAINDKRLLTVGGTRKNVGDIWCGNGTFTDGVPAQKYNYMTAGHSLNKAGLYTIPLGKTGHLIQVVQMVGDTNKSVDCLIKVDDGVIERVVAPFELGQGNFVAQAIGASPIPALTMLKSEVKVSSTTACVVIFIVILLKDD